VYGPEAIREICDKLAREDDDARCNELIARLRMIVQEDREELSGRLQFLAGRLLRGERGKRRNGLERGHQSERDERQGLIIVVHSDPSEWHSPRE